MPVASVVTTPTTSGPNTPEETSYVYLPSWNTFGASQFPTEQARGVKPSSRFPLKIPRITSRWEGIREPFFDPSKGYVRPRGANGTIYKISGALIRKLLDWTVLSALPEDQGIRNKKSLAKADVFRAVKETFSYESRHNQPTSVTCEYIQREARYEIVIQWPDWSEPQQFSVLAVPLDPKEEHERTAPAPSYILNGPTGYKMPAQKYEHYTFKGKTFTDLCKQLGTYGTQPYEVWLRQHIQMEQEATPPSISTLESPSLTSDKISVCSEEVTFVEPRSHNKKGTRRPSLRRPSSRRASWNHERRNLELRGTRRISSASQLHEAAVEKKLESIIHQLEEERKQRFPHLA